MKKESLNFIENQIDRFKDVQPVYAVFAKILKRVLEKEVPKLGIYPIVQSRPKDMASFIGKCFLKQAQMDQRDKGERRSFVHSFTDLCGARVIVESKDQIDPVCDFLRAHFDIDEGNSVDPIAALGDSKFAYRPVHFIVALREGLFKSHIESARMDEPEGNARKFDAAVGQLIGRRDTYEECDGIQLPYGPRFKAEVQVRTLLEHAWATLNHDRMYKGGVELPQALRRDMNRVMAVLEEADKDLALVIEQLDTYRTAKGKYQRAEERTDEMARLKVTLTHAPDRIGLAQRFAQLAAEQKNWQLVIDTLAPRVEAWRNSEHGTKFMRDYTGFKQATSPAEQKRLLRDLDGMRHAAMSGVLTELGWAQWKLARLSSDTRAESPARILIEMGTLLDNRNADARIRLGQTYVQRHRDLQKHCYDEAFRIAPSDPGILRQYLHDRLVANPNFNGIPSLRASLLQAIEICRRWADVGVCLPQALYQSGFFKLLLEQGRSPVDGESGLLDAATMASIVGSLRDYARAAELSESEADINAERQDIEALHDAVGMNFPGVVWVKHLLLLEMGAKAWARAIEQRAKGREASEKAIQEGKLNAAILAMDEVTAATKEARNTAMSCLADVVSSDCPGFAGPIALIVGGCNKASEPIVGRYSSHIVTALSDFGGTVFCGGTMAGISGIVGNAASTKSSFRRMAYVRAGAYVAARLMKRDEGGKGYDLRFLPGDGFTPLEVIQVWIDLLASGIDPSEVSVLGINGGTIAAFELRLALSMGARVGVVRESGGAARDILDDQDWKDHPRLLILPDDVQTVKALVLGKRVSEKFDEATRDRIAEFQHNGNATERRRKNMKTADRDWTELDPFFKQDIRQRIDYWDVLLDAVGMQIVKADAVPVGAEIVENKFDPADIDRMAEMEHARWNVNRLSAGQRYGRDKKDKETHPDLIPWRELPKKEREKDIQYVGQILTVKDFGYCIIRQKKT